MIKVWLIKERTAMRIINNNKKSKEVVGYYIATRTRKQTFVYSICETLNEARETLAERYSDVFRIGIYEYNIYGEFKKVA